MGTNKIIIKKPLLDFFRIRYYTLLKCRSCLKWMKSNQVMHRRFFSVVVAFKLLSLLKRLHCNLFYHHSCRNGLFQFQETWVDDVVLLYNTTNKTEPVTFIKPLLWRQSVLLLEEKTIAVIASAFCYWGIVQHTIWRYGTVRVFQFSR